MSVSDGPVAVTPTPASIESMFGYILYNAVVRAAALAKLQPLHFVPQTEVVYAAFWDSFLRHCRGRTSAPEKQPIVCDTLSALQNNPFVSDKEIESAKGFLEWLWGAADDDWSNERYGLALLRLFLIDRARRAGHDALSDSRAHEANARLPEIINDISKRLQDAITVEKAPSGDVIPDVWPVDSGRERFRTGLPFIDQYTVTYPRDVNVILGPTGVGKTMLALQILGSAAREQFAMHRENAGWCAYFGYEGDISMPRNRLISCLARIKISRLAEIKSYADLSDSTCLQPYERQLYAISGSSAKWGERDRLESVRPWVQQCIKIFNFSGSRDEQGFSFGSGGLPEIKSVIERTLNALGRPLKLAVIDWAGMVVRRYLEARNRQIERCLTLELESFIDRVYQEIAIPYDCVVFVVHQLRGAVTRMSPVAQVTHGDAAWCSNFAVNAWNVICLGNKDLSTGAFTMSWTKTRNGPGKQGLICRIEEDFCRVVDDDSYYLDYATRQIVKATEPYDGRYYESAADNAALRDLP